MQSCNDKFLLDSITFLNDTISKFDNFDFSMSPFSKTLIKDPYQIGKNEFINKVLTSDKIKSKLFKLPDLNSSNLLQYNIVDNNVVKQLIDKIENNEIFIEKLTKKELRLLASYSNLPIENITLYKQLVEIVINKGVTSRLFMAFLIGFYNIYDYILDDTTKICSIYFYKLWNTYFSQKTTKFSNNMINLKNISAEIFSNDLHSYIADYYINNENINSSIEDVISCKYPYISINSQLFKRVIIKISEICSQNINEIKYRNILIYNILSSNSIPKEILDEIINHVIEIYSDSNANIDAKQQIKKIIINNHNYGDPRLNTIQWANINKNAKQIFISWLSKDDLEFFFDVIFKDKSDIQKRKQFWINYVNSKELVGSKVILCKEDFQKWKSLPSEQTEGRSIGTFVNSIEDTSCFILEFYNSVIVEFSKENNALYIYDKSSFRVNISARSFNWSSLRSSRATRISLKNFFDYDANGINKGLKENLPDLAHNKVVSIYHTEKIPAGIKTNYERGWHWITARFLAYIGIYPGEE